MISQKKALRNSKGFFNGLSAGILMLMVCTFLRQMPFSNQQHFELSVRIHGSFKPYTNPSMFSL